MKIKYLAGVLAVLSLNSYADFQSDAKTKFPQIKDSKIEKSFGNFYSVVTGQEVIYLSDDLKYIVNGEVVDITTGKSLTQALKDANRPVMNIKDLNLKDAIKIGDGSRKMYVFSDPQCPYCKQVEREFDSLKDVTIYIFPMPLTSLHPDAQAITESIWCSKDKGKAWHDFVANGVKPAPQACSKNPVERNLALAKKYAIFGTPALIFENGEIVPGAASASVISEKLNNAKR